MLRATARISTPRTSSRLSRPAAVPRVQRPAVTHDVRVNFFSKFRTDSADAGRPWPISGVLNVQFPASLG